jgi:IMP dehydrogenase
MSTSTNAVSTLNAQLFDTPEALTFDDVVIVPGFSSVLPDSADVSATFARDIVLSIPIVSAAMDRVTESNMAIAIARAGGIGVVHRNMSIEDQAAHVNRVKRSQSGWITDPVTLRADALLSDAEDIMSRFHISGVPIVDHNKRLVGILTNRDTRFCTDADYKRHDIDFMTHTTLISESLGTTL